MLEQSLKIRQSQWWSVTFQKCLSNPKAIRGVMLRVKARLQVICVSFLVWLSRLCLIEGAQDGDPVLMNIRQRIFGPGEGVEAEECSTFSFLFIGRRLAWFSCFAPTLLRCVSSSRSWCHVRNCDWNSLCVVRNRPQNQSEVSCLVFFFFCTAALTKTSLGTKYKTYLIKTL